MPKLTKKAANYRADGSPQKHCAICTMFRKGNVCTSVQGYIAPDAVCKLFKRKKSNPLKQVTHYAKVTPL